MKKKLKGLELVNLWDKLRQDVHEYFGYKEDWVCIPMELQTERHWMICGPEDDNSTKVTFSDSPFTKESIEAGSDVYSGTIYTQRFLPKWVYRAEDLTMIAVDTHCDGNRILMIFKNDMECKDESLKELYKECW